MVKKPKRPDTLHLRATARGMPSPTGYSAQQLRLAADYIEWSDMENAKLKGKVIALEDAHKKCLDRHY